MAAAVAVVSEHGPGAFSARAVATAAGLPLGAVSYYFPRLDDLLGTAIVEVVRGWLGQGESVVTALHGKGPDAAATAITEALLPSGPAAAVRNRYEHLLAAAGNPVAAAEMAELRPALHSLVGRILTSTRATTPLTPDAIIALVDGAAVGAVSEGAVDPRERVATTLREALGGNPSLEPS